MPRIRTIKPEFFCHEELFDLEVETKLPLRIAFAGLWTICDREGRFKWRPRAIKAQVLPFDDVDFSRVLDALTTRGFVVKYASSGAEYGHVPGFGRHQVVNNREAASVLPKPPETPQNTGDSRVPDASPARDPRDDHAGAGEGKGTEGEQEGKGNSLSHSQNDYEKRIDPKLLPHWLRWCEWRLATTGEKINAITAEVMVMDLERRGVEKAIRDIDFTILLNRKSDRILDSDNDFQKRSNHTAKPRVTLT
jgi:hypothetical protein